MAGFKRRIITKSSSYRQAEKRQQTLHELVATHSYLRAVAQGFNLNERRPMLNILSK